MPTPKKYTAKDGTVTWRVRFRLAGRETSETFTTHRAATIFCSDLAARGAAYAVRMRDEEDRDQRSPTLDVLAEQFLDHRARRVRSDRTIADYRRDYRKWISPTLGDRPITTITEADVQALVEDWAGKLAPKSVLDRHALLHGIIRHAMSTAGGKWIEADPCAETDLPRKRRTPPKALRPAEWEALHRALRQIDPDAADLALVMVASGLRWSEATALDGWAMDDHGTHVSLTVGRVVRRNAAGQHVIVQDTKAEASARTVALDPQTSDMVRQRAARAGAGLIFTNARGRQWHYSNFVNRAWRPAISAANLSRRPTPHWLRHTATVWLLQAGASLPDVQARIGHASVTTTIGTYGTSITDVSPAALAAFAQALGSGRGAPDDVQHVDAEGGTHALDLGEGHRLLPGQDA